MFSLAYYCYLPTTDSLIALDKSQRFSAKEQTSMNSMLAMVYCENKINLNFLSFY